MIHTTDEGHALEFLAVAHRLGMGPTVAPAAARDYWELETRDMTLGEALWELLDCMPGARVQWHDVTTMADCLAAPENYYPDFQPGGVRIGSTAYSAADLAERDGGL